MKQLTSLEINHLVKEFHFLIDAKIDKIYQPDKKTFYFQFYVTNKGKHILKVKLPSFIYMTEYKESTEESEEYCKFLRKYIQNSKLKHIKQLGSERIIEFMFKKEKKYYLIIELFSKGNILLTDDKHKIISPLEIQKWKNRIIKKGETYKYPKREYNFMDIDIGQLSKLIKKTDKDKIVTLLASDLGLGGLYSEELCLLSKIDKNKPPKELDNTEIKSIFNSLKKIINKNPKPNIIFKDNRVTDTIPFDLNTYKDNKKQSFDTYSKAIDRFLIEESKLDTKPKTDYEKKIKKINKIIETQQQSIESINKKIKENQDKAETIYNNYKLINEILTEITKARKKFSWKEIKQRLKGHNIIKEVNEKDKKIIIELN